MDSEKARAMITDFRRLHGRWTNKSVLDFVESIESSKTENKLEESREKNAETGLKNIKDKDALEDQEAFQPQYRWRNSDNRKMKQERGLYKRVPEELFFQFYEFLKDVKLLGGSDQGRLNIIRNVGQVLYYVYSESRLPTNELHYQALSTIKYIVDYFNQLEACKIRNQTLKNYLLGMKYFYQYLVEDSHLDFFNKDRRLYDRLRHAQLQLTGYKKPTKGMCKEQNKKKLEDEQLYLGSSPADLVWPFCSLAMDRVNRILQDAEAGSIVTVNDMSFVVGFIVAQICLVNFQRPMVAKKLTVGEYIAAEASAEGSGYRVFKVAEHKTQCVQPATFAVSEELWRIMNGYYLHIRPRFTKKDLDNSGHKEQGEASDNLICRFLVNCKGEELNNPCNNLRKFQETVALMLGQESVLPSTQNTVRNIIESGKLPVFSATDARKMIATEASLSQITMEERQDVCSYLAHSFAISKSRYQVGSLNKVRKTRTILDKLMAGTKTAIRNQAIGYKTQQTQGTQRKSMHEMNDQCIKEQHLSKSQRLQQLTQNTESKFTFTKQRELEMMLNHKFPPNPDDLSTVPKTNPVVKNIYKSLELEDTDAIRRWFKNWNERRKTKSSKERSLAFLKEKFSPTKTSKTNLRRLFETERRKDKGQLAGCRAKAFLTAVNEYNSSFSPFTKRMRSKST